MKRFLSITALALAFIFAGCSDSTSVNVKIGEIGEVEDVLSVQTLTGDGKVHLSWERPADTIGVSIRKLATGFPFSVTSGEEIYAGDASEFIDEDVIFGERYYYLIVAIDENLNFAGGIKKSSVAWHSGNTVNYTGAYSTNLRSICIDDNYIYAAGVFVDSAADYSSGTGDKKLIIEKRDKSNGLLDPSFGVDGIISSNPSSGPDVYSAIEFDAEYIYVTGYVYNSSASNNEWYTEKRRKDTGAFVSTFGTDGVIHDSSFKGNLYTMEADNNYLYLGGNDFSSSDSTSEWRIEKRRKDTGALVTSFDGDGVIQNDILTSGYEVITSITIDSEYIYIGGVDVNSSDSSSEWRIEKRRKDTGALVASFDVDGIITLSMYTGGEVLYSITNDDDYIYAGGIFYNSGSETRGWVISKFNKTTGAYEYGIPVAGVSDALKLLTSVQIDNDYIYGLGNETDSTFSIYKYSKTDGSAVTSFGIMGCIEYSTFTSGNIATNAFISEDYIYTCGWCKTDIKGGNINVINRTTGLFYSGSLFELE